MLDAAVDHVRSERRCDNSLWLVDVADATDTALCGGKAAGLAKLERASFSVSAAICLTTAFYRRWLESSGVAPHLAVVATEPLQDPGIRRDSLALNRAPDLAPGP
jgi:hypothetical protein